MARKRYTGELAEPIRIEHYTPIILEPPPPIPGLVAAINDLNKKAAADSLIAAGEAKRRKLDLLFDHFEIEDHTDYRSLSMKLAEAHVNGFRLVSADARGKGRPKGDWQLMRLLADAEVINRRKGLTQSSASDAKAVEDLRSQTKFATRWGRYSARTLRNMLTEARNPAKNPMYLLWQAGGPTGTWPIEETKRIRKSILDFFSITRNGF